MSIISIICISLIISSVFSIESNSKLERNTFSLRPPFPIGIIIIKKLCIDFYLRLGNSGILNWEYGGSAYVRDDTVILTEDVSSSSGWIWNTNVSFDVF